ncbi:MAG: hypothetical protein JW806_06325 [Sedimentisphaerales bacterium]|nr:hypothetical protein [Sedimentisphaerales bacterium]
MWKYVPCLVVILVSAAYGQTDVYIYNADEITPFEHQEIMVGTKLTFIVNSDSNDYWNGGLFISGNNRDFGVLSARDYDANTRDYTGSHFEEAGNCARVTGWRDSSIWGFDMCTFYPIGDANDNNTQPGDWFIIDYTAKAAGDCNVGFYDYSVSWYEPVYDVNFTQVKSRDFNNDGKVDFQDYLILASNWIRDDCIDPNWCDGTDLNQDGSIDCTDLGDFIEFWLWPELPVEPPDNNEPPIPVDANIIISIVDVNDNNEITIDVNESITLYLKLTTTELGSLSVFDVEVTISDTDLGSIDNREYNPNDPNDPNNGTARILAQPRDPFFDYIGPGYEQAEGISLVAVNMEADFNDGSLASFVFTCEGPGDVILELKSYSTDPYPKLESILIHQIDPNSQQMMSGGDRATEDTQMPEDIDPEELAEWLEDIRANDPNVDETIIEEDWSQFIDSVKNTEDPY